MYAAISYFENKELFFVSGTTGMIPFGDNDKKAGVRAPEYGHLLVHKLLPACRKMFEHQNESFIF